jgi:hypothetical protein
VLTGASRVDGGEAPTIAAVDDGDPLAARVQGAKQFAVHFVVSQPFHPDHGVLYNRPVAIEQTQP